jgi:hypothetical protein
MSLRDLRKPRSFAFHVGLFFLFMLCTAMSIYSAVRNHGGWRVTEALAAVLFAFAGLRFAWNVVSERRTVTSDEGVNAG